MAVIVIYGRTADDGLTAAGDQSWQKACPGIDDIAQASDRFARALGAGDFNGDGKDNLAVGVPGEALP
jgi:hypothetical protein